jgi:hypothetical protein
MTLIGFRILLVLNAATFLAWFFYPFVNTSVDPGIASLREWHGTGSVLNTGVLAVIAWVTFFMRFVATVGMWVLARWGTWLFTALIVVSVLLAPLLGVSIQTPSEVVLSFLSSLLDGALIAVAFARSSTLENVPNVAGRTEL